MKSPFTLCSNHFTRVLFVSVVCMCLATSAFSQKHKAKNDSIAVRDSIKELMFQGALLSMDALQTKVEAQKREDFTQKRQKGAESQNLFIQSRSCYRRAIGYDANYYPAWTSMGTTYFLQDLPKAAIPCYRKALLINPNYSPAWYNLGKAYDMISMQDSAVYSYKESIRSDSTQLLAYEELSRIIMIRDKDTSAALKMLRLAAYYKPISEVPYVAMSELYFSVNDSLHGIAAMETAANIYNGDVDRLQFLADYFQSHNNPERSLYYQTLLATVRKRQEVQK